MPSKKRSRLDADENRAECPFSVKQKSPTAQEIAQDAARRARGEPLEEDRKSQWHWQCSPFSPAGFTKNAESMDVKYSVSPYSDWSSMTRYNSFVLGKDKFHTDDFVKVANEESVKRLKTGEVNGTEDRKDNDWVARILEIRAKDEQHVYARVYWMYWPDELPYGTRVGRKIIDGGRQPYHGKHELVASNHMDVINAVSVTRAAEVNHWIETDEEDTQSALYWRQAFNCNTSQLSTAKDVCKCETPAHPDKTLIRCSNSDCGKWMHDDCLRHDVLTRVFKRLGKTEPQIFDHHEMKNEGEKSLASPPATDTEKAESDDRPSMNDVRLPLYTGQSPSTEQLWARKGPKKEPYRGIFQATIQINNGPTVWQIEDLRTDVNGGSKKWLERARCLFCSSSID